MLPVDLLQATSFDVSIDLRGCNRGVTKHGLDGAKIGPALEQMRRKGMPQHVRRNRLRDPRAPRALSKEFPTRLSTQAASSS
jgi:hypothetical protein